MSLSSSLNCTNNKSEIDERKRLAATWMKEVAEVSWDIEKWWKERGVKILTEHGMSEGDIKEFWESKLWFWGECKIVLEMLAAKVMEIDKKGMNQK